MNLPRNSTTTLRLREMGLVCCLAALGLPVLILDAELALAWLALTAPATGGLAGACALPLWTATTASAGLWFVMLALNQNSDVSALPTPWWAALVLLGLLYIGWAIGRLACKPALQVAGSLSFAVSLLAALPAGGSWVQAPWSPVWGARALNASPVVLVEEAAGVDWMRHPAVYDWVGTHSIGPDLRLPYRGRLAGPAVLLVGCLAAGVANRLRARRRPDPEDS